MLLQKQTNKSTWTQKRPRLFCFEFTENGLEEFILILLKSYLAFF